MSVRTQEAAIAERDKACNCAPGFDAARERRDQRTKEYESVVALMQDTGQAVWVINGTYVIALTFLIGGLASLVSQPNATPLQLWIAVLGALLSLVVAYLWLASFERNYTFYNLRIHIARTLERQVGFSLLTKGADLSEGKKVTVIEGQPLQIPRWAGAGIQLYTRSLIIVFVLLLLGLMFIGVCRLLDTGGNTCWMLLAVRPLLSL